MGFPNNMNNQRVAVIGGGIAGLGAAWALSRHCRVSLYDANRYFGGHANTVDVETAQGRIPVDTGFIVYNEPNYPHLRRLFSALDVPSFASDMSFGVSLNHGRIEYSGSSLRGLFAQPRNLVRQRFWRMLIDIRRFYQRADAYLQSGAAQCSLGDLLMQEQYSQAFVDDHLVPMAAAIWSASREDIWRHPADAFIKFFANHGLLQISERPQWRSVVGGSREYVRRLLANADCERHIASAVVEISRHPSHVLIRTADGTAESFDGVVVATHADTALDLFTQVSSAERAILDKFGYSANRAVLHEDTGLMPQRRAAWSSWNYLGGPRQNEEYTPLCVSYWMNRLQQLDTERDLFVTLNPNRNIPDDKVHASIDYSHPIFTQETALAQQQSVSIQGQNRTWFCGSYLGNGFHEDALQSGLWVAEQIVGQSAWREQVAYDRLPRSYATETRDVA